MRFSVNTRAEGGGSSRTAGLARLFAGWPELSKGAGGDYRIRSLGSLIPKSEIENEKLKRKKREWKVGCDTIWDGDCDRSERDAGEGMVR